VLLGRSVRLDLDGLQDKIVRAHRGGYCFEHSTLFAAVLEALGFQIARHAARVVLFGPLADAKRDHMFMTVAIGGASYVADPGFGPFAPRFPVPLVDSPAGQTTHWMQRDGNFWVMHVTREDRQPVAGWASTLEVENPKDFEVFNHYIATHPKSPFVNWIFLSKVTPEGRVNVMNRKVTFLHEAEGSMPWNWRTVRRCVDCWRSISASICPRSSAWPFRRFPSGPERRMRRLATGRIMRPLLCSGS
jgi:N-hydroxyarylamine O-acetyltransferase